MSPAQLPSAPSTGRSRSTTRASDCSGWGSSARRRRICGRGWRWRSPSARNSPSSTRSVTSLCCEAEQGRLRDADGPRQQRLDLAEKRGWRSALQVVPAYLALALTHLERNALGEAEAAFQHGLAAQRAEPEPVQYFALRIAEARILLARGEADAARLITNQIRLEIGGRRTAARSRRWLAIAEAEIELAAGNPDEVLRIGRIRQGRKHGPRMQICVARAHLALGEPETAETMLAPLHTSAPDVGSAVEAWLVTALVEDALRQNNRSADAFARAVALAEPEGIRRPFVGIEPSRIAALWNATNGWRREVSRSSPNCSPTRRRTARCGRTGPTKHSPNGSWTSCAISRPC